MRVAAGLLLLVLPAAAEPFPDTLRRLAHEDADARRKACAAIGERGWWTSQAVAALTDATRDPADARRVADAALAQWRASPNERAAVAAALAEIAHAAKNGAAAAEAALHDMRSYAGPAAPALVVALSDRDAAVRLRAVIALGRFCAEERAVAFSPPPAERWLGDFGRWTPEHVGGEGRAVVAAALAARLADDDARVRAEADRALESMGAAARPAAAALVQALVRGERHAAQTLGRIGLDAAPLLRPLLRHDDADVRVRALDALATMDPVPVADLALGLKDAEARVREQTARMLAHAGPDAAAATAALAEALGDAQAGVRGLVARALRKIGPAAADAGPALAKALGDGDGQVAIAAARALAAVDPGQRERAFRKLVELMEHTYSGVRHMAAYYLPELAPPGNGVRALVRRTADEDLDVRMTAALSLWRVLHAKTVADAAAEAKRLLEGGPPERAEPGARAVVAPDARDIPITVLVGGLGHEDSAVRIRAVHALGRIVAEALAAGERFRVAVETFYRRADVEAALRKALDDSDGGVRAAAGRALEPLSR